jgi:hypothetical protein
VSERDVKCEREEHRDKIKKRYRKRKKGLCKWLCVRERRRMRDKKTRTNKRKEERKTGT